MFTGLNYACYDSSVTVKSVRGIQKSLWIGINGRCPIKFAAASWGVQFWHVLISPFALTGEQLYVWTVILWPFKISGKTFLKWIQLQCHSVFFHITACRISWYILSCMLVHVCRCSHYIASVSNILCHKNLTPIISVNLNLVCQWAKKNGSDNTM